MEKAKFSLNALFNIVVWLELIALLVWASVILIDNTLFFLKSEYIVGVILGAGYDGDFAEGLNTVEQYQAVEYEVDGQAYTYKNHKYVGNPGYDMLHPYPLIYNRDDPSQARAYSAGGYWGAPALFLAIDVAGLMYWYATRRSRLRSHPFQQHLLPVNENLVWLIYIAWVLVFGLAGILVVPFAANFPLFLPLMFSIQGDILFALLVALMDALIVSLATTSILRPMLDDSAGLGWWLINGITFLIAAVVLNILLSSTIWLGLALPGVLVFGYLLARCQGYYLRARLGLAPGETSGMGWLEAATILGFALIQLINFLVFVWLPGMIVAGIL